MKWHIEYLLIQWIYCCRERSKRFYCLMKSWRTRAENYALYLKLLITPLVREASQRRHVFYRLDVLIDSVSDFIIVHGGSIQHAHDAFVAGDSVSGAKARLELAVRNFYAVLPSCVAEHVRVLDPVNHLLRG